jgi:CRP/FNR family cyclic AMP-dependent transcriptional regulator
VLSSRPIRERHLTDSHREPTSKPAFDTKQFLNTLDRGVTIANYEKNQKVYTQGDIADSVFYIQNGKVKVSVLSEQGKEAVIGILAQGQFGEGCLERQKIRSATTHAMEDCLITRLTRSRMMAALEAEPKFSSFFMTYLLSRNARIEDDLIDQLFNSSERRLARLLLLLADFGKGGATKPVPVTLSQEALADMIGTTRSRVSHFRGQGSGS